MTIRHSTLRSSTATTSTSYSQLDRESSSKNDVLKAKASLRVGEVCHETA
ncbi:hypothetical protein TUMSATVNIG3_56740 (plasmid) [Vibrio nigripulchritudo]|nr:hypothetical protein TUMSATVNIG2_56050 [Vibrio nigripulchritudo]BDU46876.1 hypothetical protein TUMSATVNIG3_56740 [Vibrio nigripulchritudo]